MRSVVFDLDGTLADTSADLLAAANGCFRDAGLDDLLTRADAGTALRGGRALLRLGFARVDGFGEADVERAYPRLLERYAAAICEETALYPGAREAIERLRAAGYRTAVCTLKPDGLTRALLVALDVADLFDAVTGADTLAVRKPEAAAFHETVALAGGTRGRACMVGDSDTDRMTARAAGAPCLLVTFGPDGAAMAAQEPDALLGSYADLFDAVEALRL